MIRSRLVAVLVLVVVGAAACTGSGSKAGGEAEPVVLELADPYEDASFEPAVAFFMDRIEELSGGQIRIQHVQGWGDLQPDFEQQIVRDVAAAEADLGWVGTRIFDTLGVTSFQALTAPMLIDSYPLERAVIASSIPSEMLEGLETLDVTGLAVLGDGLRKPISQDHPLVTLSDWEGVTFNVFRSEGQMAAIAATGAEPTDVSFGEVAYAAGERNLRIYEKNYVAQYRHVTANVNLWPQTVALIANPDSLSRLTDEQLGWVRQAATDAAARSTDFFDQDQDIVATTCAKGARYAEASEADLTSLRQAFDGVYADLELDAQTKVFIEQIEAMKRTTSAGPALQIPADCRSTAQEPATTEPLQGRWQTDPLTESQIVQAFVAAGGTEQAAHEWFAELGGGAEESVVIRLDFQHGTLDEYDSADGGPFVHGDSSGYTVEGDTMTSIRDTCTVEFSVAIDQDTLRLRLRPPATCLRGDLPYGTTLYGSFPFTRVP